MIYFLHNDTITVVARVILCSWCVLLNERNSSLFTLIQPLLLLIKLASVFVKFSLIPSPSVINSLSVILNGM